MRMRAHSPRVRNQDPDPDPPGRIIFVLRAWSDIIYTELQILEESIFFFLEVLECCVELEDVQASHLGPCSAWCLKSIQGSQGITQERKYPLGWS
ncbi:uncharacterized protein LOC135336630 isoform X2 [Halichondria panicea]|uniref:uncharacterized protein LOC135336630 isoform X2 n=1 Tax=Halichondria panicea TaxID=6063 RepID=UPI00312B3AD3